MARKVTNKALDAYTATGIAEGWLEATQAQTLEAWQYLVNTGLAYQLQGSFGRQADALIAAGYIERAAA